MSEWFTEAFSSSYLEYYSHRTDVDAIEDVVFAIETLSVNENDIVLDLCSGAGRHSRAISKKCKLVVSYDLSLDLMYHATRIKTAQNISNIWTVCGDARDLFYQNSFDIVLNYFNSFGYFNEKENYAFLKRIQNSLKPNGAFLLDLMNPSYLKSNLLTESVKETENYHFHEKRFILNSESKVEKEVQVFSKKTGDLLKKYKESVRYYEPKEIFELLESAGFKVFGSYGDNKGGALQTDSNRHLISIRKLN